MASCGVLEGYEAGEAYLAGAGGRDPGASKCLMESGTAQRRRTALWHQQQTFCCRTWIR